jgi:hypothetical protein
LSVFAGLLAALFTPPATEGDIRREVWALGGRHRGNALEGARAELAANGLGVRRAMLLRAVIRSLTPHPA